MSDETIYEWNCHCFGENAQDGDMVKVWYSAIGEEADYGAGHGPRPKDPCPNCKKTDRIRRMSTLPERWTP